MFLVCETMNMGMKKLKRKAPIRLLRLASESRVRYPVIHIKITFRTARKNPFTMSVPIGFLVRAPILMALAIKVTIDFNRKNYLICDCW